LALSIFKITLLSTFQTSLLTISLTIELSVENMVRRVLNLIREEDYSISAEAGSEMSQQEKRDLLKHNVIDAIREMIDELENASSNIASQALEHIHSK
jgi:translation initiation factor eIF-2B subunit beta